MKRAQQPKPLLLPAGSLLLHVSKRNPSQTGDPH